MDVQIPADLSEFVGGLVAAGRFGTENQVSVESLRLLQTREELRRDVAAGIVQLDRGEGLDEDQVLAELGREIDEIEQLRDE